MTTAPLLVSMIVPCRNEARHIGRCLESLLEMDYPADRMEILVVDGRSDDGTQAIVDHYATRDPRVRLLDNPHRITSHALNLGIQASRGDAVMLIGAHSEYPSHYVRNLIERLQSTIADAVGGTCQTLPGGPGELAAAIAAVLSHPFGVGNSYFRIGAGSDRWVDTVPFGCYRRDVFDRFGLFDEALVRNQDDEFNLRIGRGGGRLLLVASVSCRYYARPSIRQTARMFYQYGLYKPLVARKLGRVMTARQLAPAALIVGLAGAAAMPLVPQLGWLPLAGVVGAYLAADLGASVNMVWRRVRGARLALAVFPVVHLSYGLGFLVGIGRLVRGWGRWRERSTPLELSR